MKNQRLTQIHDHTATVAGPSLRLCLIQATSSPFGQAQGVAQGQGYVGLTTGVTLAFRGRQVAGVGMDAILRLWPGQTSAWAAWSFFAGHDVH